MSQVLHINHDDSRVMYKGDWGRNEDSSFTLSGEFCVLFRGTIDPHLLNLLLHMIADQV